LSLLDGGKAFGDSIGWESRVGYGSGHILLPADFLRLLVFRMSDWSRSVSEVITEDDPRYDMQRSRYSGVKGTPDRPVVAITNQPVGKVLEFYSCTQGADVYIKMARYVPRPVIKMVDDVEVIDLSPKIVRAVVYYAAALVAESVGENERGKVLRDVANELLGVGVEGTAIA
jgi:hypothetical protein